MTPSEAVEFLAGTRLFLTSRERIKQPEGSDLFDEAIDTLRTTLSARASAGEGGVDEHVRLLVGKLDQWRMCMSHNQSYFGEPAGLVKATIAELAKAVDPIYPPKPEPVDPLAGVAIYTATFPLNAAPQPAQAGASGGGEFARGVEFGRADERASRALDAVIIPPAHGDGEGVPRESRMVVIQRDASGKPTVWCDPEIADLVSTLNAGGIPTVASCSGHGERHGNIALADGRELLIAPDFDTARAMDSILLTRPTPEAQEARDAARYRHMRDRNNSLERFQRDKDNGTSCYHVVDGVRELKSGDELDAAIDAAIELRAHGGMGHG